MVEQVTHEKASTPDVPPSESLERVLAGDDTYHSNILKGNYKIQYDNAMNQSNLTNTNSINQTNMTNTNAQTFREQLQHEHLLDLKQEREHKDLRFRHDLANDRYTLNSLYTIPEDMLALPTNLVPLLEAVLQYLKETQNKETPPTP